MIAVTGTLAYDIQFDGPDRSLSSRSGDAFTAGYFKTLGEHPSCADVQFYIGWESSARNHGRIMDLMDEISDLREAASEA